MAEVLVEYTDVVVRKDGSQYLARACGAETDAGTWQGWLEFVEPSGGETFRTARETTQPNRTDTLYWATGLTAVYLEGALERALHPATTPSPRTGPNDLFVPPSGPAPDFTTDPPPAESILNPFSVYRKGEALLRRQLGAFSSWHLVNIIRAHGLSDESSTMLNVMEQEVLIETIVAGVKARNAETLSR